MDIRKIYGWHFPTSSVECLPKKEGRRFQVFVTKVPCLPVRWRGYQRACIPKCPQSRGRSVTGYCLHRPVATEKKGCILQVCLASSWGFCFESTFDKVQVVPGRAGGGSFKRKKNYIAKKEFAYRMCARWPTIAMSKFFSEVWTKLLPLHGCHVMRFGVMCLWFDLLSNDVASCEVICGTTPTYYSSTTLYSVLQSTTPVLLVLQSTTPVLLCTTKYYSGTTLYYTVLRQYYSVLPSTTTYYSVLQSTTTYYSSTTLYYKVLLQYHSVLQSTTPVLQSTTPVLLCTTKYYNVLLQYYSVLKSTTPVLLCTTKYYSSTTLQYYNVLLCSTKYYKVLLQYYSVLQSTTPVLLCTTKYYSSTTLYDKVLLRYYSVLQSTTTYYSSTTLYYKVLLQYHSVLQSTTPVLLCTTPVLQLTTPVLLWNVIYNARRNKSQRPTSPNTAPATQNECHQWSASHMKRHFQCVEQVKSPSNLTKYCAYHEILKLKISADTPWMLPPIERRFEDIRR